MLFHVVTKVFLNDIFNDDLLNMPGPVTCEVLQCSWLLKVNCIIIRNRGGVKVCSGYRCSKLR